MDPLSWIVFGGAVLPSMTPSCSHIAVVGASDLVSLPVLTAAASLITMVNVAIALKGHVGRVHRKLFLWIACGQLPAIGVGVWLMAHLDATAQGVLKGLLGTFITLGCLSMMIRPEPLRRVSPAWACLGAGAAGGVVGGMFSASGPIMGWFTYRQPLEVAAIRATLLGAFALTTSVRTVVGGLDGGLTREVWWLVLLALPMVVVGTWLGRELPPPLSETAMKRSAFGLLLAMGLWILWQSVS